MATFEVRVTQTRQITKIATIQIEAEDRKAAEKKMALYQYNPPAHDEEWEWTEISNEHYLEEAEIIFDHDDPEA